MALKYAIQLCSVYENEKNKWIICLYFVAVILLNCGDGNRPLLKLISAL